jgi:pilus assembly protein Flp/PilA
MNKLLLNLHSGLYSLLSREAGQDLIEYALVVAPIALGATAGMKTLAGGVNSAFFSVSVSLRTDI